MMGFEVAERARSWLGVPRDSSRSAMRDTVAGARARIQRSPRRRRRLHVSTTYVVPMRMRARDLREAHDHEFIARCNPSGTCGS